MIQPKFDIGDTVLIAGTVKRIIIYDEDTMDYVVQFEDRFDGRDHKSNLVVTEKSIVNIPKDPLKYGDVR